MAYRYEVNCSLLWLLSQACEFCKNFGPKFACIQELLGSWGEEEFCNCLLEYKV